MSIKLLILPVVSLPEHFDFPPSSELILRCNRPLLPSRQLYSHSVNILLIWRQRTTTTFQNQCPVGAHPVIALTKLVEIGFRMPRTVIEAPMQLFTLQGLVKSFRQAQLGRRTICNAHIPEQP